MVRQMPTLLSCQLRTRCQHYYSVQLRTGYGGRLTKRQIVEARQLTQLARDESCQLIIPYKTVEEING